VSEFFSKKYFFNLFFILRVYYKAIKEKRLKKIIRGRIYTRKSGREEMNYMRKKLMVCAVAAMMLIMAAGCGAGQVSSQPAPESQNVEQPQPVEQPQQDVQSQAEQPVQVDADLIGEDKAKEIAIAKVQGASVNDIWSFDLDYDDGRWMYEGEIHYGEWEYEFEINAESGDIVGWEKEHIYD